MKGGGTEARKGVGKETRAPLIEIVYAECD